MKTLKQIEAIDCACEEMYKELVVEKDLVKIRPENENKKQ